MRTFTFVLAIVLFTNVAHAQRTNMVRPDGTVISVDTDDAHKLERLGYREESTGERMMRAEEDSRRDYFSTTKQKVIAFIEGVAVGATAGLLAFAISDEETDNRERYAANERKAGLALGAAILALAVLYALYRTLSGKPAATAYGGATQVPYAASPTNAVPYPAPVPQSASPSTFPTTLPTRNEACASTIAAAPHNIPAANVGPVPACPACRAPTRLVQEFGRYLCERCNHYL